MKPSHLLFLAALALVISCETVPVTIEEGLSPALYFQKAQEALELDHFDTAKLYYETFLQRFPEINTDYIAAEYELAFIDYKIGRYADAKVRFQRLLGYYEQGIKNLPNWPRTLSTKILAKVEEKLAATN